MLCEVRVHIYPFSYRYPIVHAPLLRRFSFSDQIILVSLLNISCPLNKPKDGWVYFWIFNFFPLVYMSVLIPVLHCFDHCSLALSFKIVRCETSDILILSQDYIGYLGLLANPCEFADQLFHI